MGQYKSQYTGPQIDAAVSAALNPDTTPTTDSSNLVTSGGVYTAMSGKQAEITASGVLIGNGGGSVSAKTLDTSSLTNDNDHVPSSGVVKNALDGKQNTLTIDTSSLSNDSTHVPASSVVKSALSVYPRCDVRQYTVGSTTAGTAVNLDFPAALSGKTILCAVTVNGGGNSYPVFGQSYVRNSKIRFVPDTTDTSVGVTIAVFYLD